MPKKPTMRTHCLEYIRAHSPCELDEVVDFAVREKFCTSRNPHTSISTSLEAAPEIIRLPGGGYASLVSVFDGMWATVRVRHPTDGRRWLPAGPALSPVAQLLEKLGELPTEGGGDVEVDRKAVLDAWVTPTGWLPDVGAGALVGVRLQDGRLRAEPVELTDAESAELTRSVRAGVEPHLAAATRDPVGHWYPRGRTPLDRLAQAIRSAAVEVPGLFRQPTPPLSEVLAVPPAMDSLWTDVPDPWIKHTAQLRQELEWMEGQERDWAAQQRRARAREGEPFAPAPGWWEDDDSAGVVVHPFVEADEW